MALIGDRPDVRSVCGGRMRPAHEPTVSAAIAVRAKPIVTTAASQSPSQSPPSTIRTIAEITTAIGTALNSRHASRMRGMLEERNAFVVGPRAAFSPTQMA